MKNIDKLLNLNIEIEGLIRVIEYRDSHEALQLLFDKVDQFNKILNDSVAKAVDYETIQPESNESYEPDSKESYEPDNDTIENKIVIIAEEEEINPPSYDPEPISELDDPKSSMIPQQPTTDSETPKQPMMPTPEPESEAPKQPMMPTPEPADDIKCTVESLRNETVRLEDVLAKKTYKNLTRVFTLNDKYRFIRGLFCDDKNDFDYTLAQISEFQSLDGAYDYLLNELEWDIDNDEVKDFISIISNYFNAN